VSVQRPSIDASYGEVLSRLPPALRARGKRLLVELGLTETGSWTSFLRLAPNRDLPLFAAEGVADTVVDQFCVAHHCGAFYGLLADRIVDEQVAPDGELLALAGHLLSAWRGSLGGALGDVARADAAIDEAIATWHEAAADEASLVRARHYPVERYAELVSRKLGWIGLAARALQWHSGTARSAAAFRDAHDLMMIGSQCHDDAADAVEDAQRWGCGVPEALGFPSGALLHASARLTESAAAVARDGGLALFSGWLDGRARDIAAIAPAESLVAMGGWVLALKLEESWRTTAATTTMIRRATTSTVSSTTRRRRATSSSSAGTSSRPKRYPAPRGKSSRA
jgi:hypothetical protein